ncbi:CDC37 [Candida oxycetoniae]|uniref:Hsp90 chaperone protein kinase-targeting subunit n=1 Tax=Candida oxycetoniae TaxID=497107 RepID=A0AAI9WVW6_9ASCO|nr:CDC37 [Candida oxycetoniae]KAI3402465.2 CDC37 [Candida oxycetoniae]
MAIDYSKWDKIEISDDSDIEVHPNVDKRSFIKWKQRDIHEKRMQRNIEIKSILVQLTMYSKLNERCDYLLDTLKPSQFLDNGLVMSALDEKFDPKEKFDYEELIKSKGDDLRKGLRDLHFEKEEVENTPCYNEMIEDLFIQIKDDHPDAKTDSSALIEYLKEHRNKIDDVLSKQTIKLDDLLNQKAQLIVSDDLHTGFDRSFLNKAKDEDEEEEEEEKKEKEPSKEADESKKSSKKASKTVTTTETINSPSIKNSSEAATATATAAQKESDILDELNLAPETEKFGTLSTTDLIESANYLIKHTKICTEQQKDALIMSAFEAQLDGKSERAKQIIYQSLILQYVAQLKGNSKTRDDTIRAIKLFFSKFKEEEKLRAFFNEEYQNTVNHIFRRCQIIKQEQEANKSKGGDDGEEEEALIQLRALDENTTLSVNIPKEGTKEYEVFKTKLPLEFQNAIKSQSLEEINKEFAKLKVEDAEKILEIFNECGAISVDGYLDNEKEFEELQKEYNEQEENIAHVDDSKE